MKVIENPQDGNQIDVRESMYPTLLEVVQKNAREVGSKVSTAMGYVVSGRCRLSSEYGIAELKPGSFFSVPRTCLVDAEDTVVVISRIGYRGQYVIGAIEERGRLTYIDGCSDSVLVYPPRKGDPVFNHLHFPPGIRQSQHTHPSIRVGVVARGEGIAFGPERLGGEKFWEHALKPGCVFMLEEQEMHSFRTTESDQPMDVIAYHPESDFGPTDENHPMRNKTFIGANVLDHG